MRVGEREGGGGGGGVAGQRDAGFAPLVGERGRSGGDHGKRSGGTSADGARGCRGHNRGRQAGDRERHGGTGGGAERVFYDDRIVSSIGSRE